MTPTNHESDPELFPVLITVYHRDPPPNHGDNPDANVDGEPIQRPHTPTIITMYGLAESAETTRRREEPIITLPASPTASIASMSSITPSESASQIAANQNTDSNTNTNVGNTGIHNNNDSLITRSRVIAPRHSQRSLRTWMQIERRLAEAMGSSIIHDIDDDDDDDDDALAGACDYDSNINRSAGAERRKEVKVEQGGVES
ncbi:hypothetical protein VTJ04DRAFT_6938 [Mycothermus thermophilus]|uniref:uncharacterized protein n=1 Tax=Humicola insolens TaxID=85995 RepID=UPI003743E59C